ncbi:protein wntless homolog [Ciona intestinalis]
MAGTVLENLSTKKLLIMVFGLLCLLIGFILIGALVAPRPSMTIQQTAQACRGNSKQQFVLPRVCQHASLDHGSPNDVVFSVLIPKGGMPMIPWFQYMLTLLSFSNIYKHDNQYVPGTQLHMNITLAYSDHPAAHIEHNVWTLLAQSDEVIRDYECTFDYEKSEQSDDHQYDCDYMYLFQLGSVPHKYYLVNIRLPVDEKHPETSKNMKTGKITEANTVTITQTGGFTKVWISLKVALFTTMIFPLVWFWRRVSSLSRKSLLIEKSIFALGLSLLFLNLPLELFTIFLHAPWMLLFTDLRQGFFYVVLLSFWVIFIGEHQMDQAHRNKISSYKWQLGSICVTTLSLLGFELAERGMQIMNPFATVWSHPSAALALLVVASIGGGIYLLLICFLVFKVFRSIRFKRKFNLSKERSEYFISVVNRFRTLMLLSVVTASLTVVFFILEQKLDGVFEGLFSKDVEVASAFFTGVYGLWNIYIFLILSLYAPSHKLYDLDNDENSEQELVGVHQNLLNNHSDLFEMTQQKERED